MRQDRFGAEPPPIFSGHEFGVKRVLGNGVEHGGFYVNKTKAVHARHSDPDLKGQRWALPKDRDRLVSAQRAALYALLANVTTKRTARAWLYREQLCDILDRKQINVVSTMLVQWCTEVMRSKAEPMKEVARMIRNMGSTSGGR